MTRGTVRAVLVSVAMMGPCACRKAEKPPAPPTPQPVAVRDVRVLVTAGVDQIRLLAEEGLVAVDENGLSFAIPAHGSWIPLVANGSGTFRFGDLIRPFHHVTVQSLRSGLISVSVDEGNGWKPLNRYPGVLDLTANDEGKLRVVDSLDVELYVACVVAYEVWPTFEMETLRVQAIAARTFVLYQMIRRQDADFDIAATQGSQVYRGLRVDQTGLRAARAAEQTRAIVCTWRDGEEDRLFSTYYSAACGGRSQSAAIFGADQDVKPLAGGVSCDYCRIAPGDTYRWGPVRVPISEVQSRLVARFPQLKSLGRIQSIKVVERTAWGRPVTLRLSGSSGQSEDLLAERFRLAIGADLMHSTDCEIHLRRRYVVFTKGRGFGHGLGLCQWGAQGQALQGKHAGEILRYYYPGSKLTRVY